MAKSQKMIIKNLRSLKRRVSAPISHISFISNSRLKSYKNNHVKGIMREYKYQSKISVLNRLKNIPLTRTRQVVNVFNYILLKKSRVYAFTPKLPKLPRLPRWLKNKKLAKLPKSKKLDKLPRNKKLAKLRATLIKKRYQRSVKLKTWRFYKLNPYADVLHRS